MNKQIEELALRVARSMNRDPSCNELGAISDDEATEFATRFLAELAKQSEPVAWKFSLYRQVGAMDRQYDYLTLDEKEARKAGNFDVAPLSIAPLPQADNEQLVKALIEFYSAWTVGRTAVDGTAVDIAIAAHKARQGKEES